MLAKMAISIRATAAILALSSAATSLAGEPSKPQDGEPQREVIFADEFNASALDRDKWYVVGPDFWVNREEQAYVDDPSVLRVVDGIDGADGGALILRPLLRPGVDMGIERDANFISGRINSKGKFDFTYGRAEARIRMPDAIGVWPAFWLLGNGRWPDTGEIDIMEYVGEKDWIGVALHGPGYSGETPLVNKFFFPEGLDVTDWHNYAVEWAADEIHFEVDGQLIYRVTRPMVEYYGKWRFDTPKHIILNFAVGGIYPLKTNGIEKPYIGVPEDTVEMIKTGEIAMLVDWVRVHAPKDDKD